MQSPLTGQVEVLALPTGPPSPGDKDKGLEGHLATPEKAGRSQARGYLTGLGLSVLTCEVAPRMHTRGKQPRWQASGQGGRAFTDLPGAHWGHTPLTASSGGLPRAAVRNIHGCHCQVWGSVTTQCWAHACSDFEGRGLREGTGLWSPRS